MEWNGTTISLVGLAITQLVEIIGVVWYLSARLTTIETGSISNGEDIGKVDAKLDKHIDAFDVHIMDTKLHTTEEQRRDINRRIDKLEETVSAGHRDLSNKLDTWGTRILSK